MKTCDPCCGRGYYPEDMAVCTTCFGTGKLKDPVVLLLDVMRIALTELEGLVLIDGDEASYTVTTSEPTLIDISYHYVGGSASIRIHLPDLEGQPGQLGWDANVGPEREVQCLCAHVREMAKKVSP